MGKIEGIVTNKIRFAAMRKKLLIDLTYLARYFKPRIIEFGSGPGIYAKILEAYNYKVYTTDISNKYNLDKLIDIRKDLDFFESERHEYIIAHHVLEHIPYTIARDTVIPQFARILRINGILSMAIPHRRYWFKLAIRIPKLIDREFNLFLHRKIKHEKKHIWEIESKENIELITHTLNRLFSKVYLIHDNLESFFICIR